MFPFLFILGKQNVVFHTDKLILFVSFDLIFDDSKTVTFLNARVLSKNANNKHFNYIY